MSLEHNYIGLSSEVPSMENSDKTFACGGGGGGGLNLKATELRLGLPGSESPQRENGNINNNRGFMSGAKRGFSVAIHGGSGNWVFSNGAGSDTDFPPTASNSGKLINRWMSDSVVKDGLPHSPKPISEEKKNQVPGVTGHGVASASASKAQVVGWPPIRSFRKNTMASNSSKNDDDDDAEAKLGSGCLYIKVSMDGAPYLRKIDLKTYVSYDELSSALGKIFGGFTTGQCGSHEVPSHNGVSESRLTDLLHGSDYVLTYEDKDGDWMLVGDVPWKMFTDTCRRLRIMKSSEATGLAPRAMEKCKGSY